MTDTLSLGPVLDLIEHCRGYMSLHGSDCGNPDCQRFVKEVMAVNIPTLRALAEQHAAQLRYSAGFFRYAGDTGPADAFDAAADFLAAPRREPEAE